MKRIKLYHCAPAYVTRNCFTGTTYAKLFAILDASAYFYGTEVREGIQRNG